MEATATSIAARREPREERSFASVCEEHLDDVYAYLVYLTGDAALAEDLASETFERALRRWPRFDPRRGSAPTWLCQLARGAALDHFRSERRRRRREEAAADGRSERDPGGFVEGLSPEVDAALRRLTAGEREVIALRVVLDLDAASAARLLGISVTACTTRLGRALARLETMLKGDPDE
jgi:RNA polymerase sigma factor (sigma-70 family)